MKDALLPVYRAVAEGRMTKAEALARIRALKGDASRASSAAEARGLLLVADEWQPMPVGGDAAVPADAPRFDRVLVWGVSQRVFDALKARLGECAPLGALPMEAPAAAGDDDTAGLAERYAQAMREGFEAIRALLGGASAQSGAVSPRRVLLAIADDADAVFANGFAAMCRTAIEENPTLQLRCLQVPADIDAAGLAQALDAEMRADAGRGEAPRGALVRRRRGEGDAWIREVAGWRVAERHPQDDAQDASAAMREHVAFREGGCYLITGGAGGIGLEFAREIVRRTRRARVLLAGRSAPSPQVRRQIEALARDGHEVEHLCLDVTRGDEVDSLIARLQAQGRTLDGIVHCAGITRDGFVIRKSAEDFSAVLAPKVAGLAHLDRATRDQPLDFLLLCSSFAACWGIVGQVDYAAANAFMDACAARRNRLAAAGLRSGRTLSVDWPLWQDGGMRIDAATRARLQAHTGMQPLATASAMRALHRGLALDLDRMLVMEGELPRMLALLEGRASDAEAATLSHAPAAHAPGAQPAVTPPAGHSPPASPAADAADRDAKVLEYITRQFSQVLKIPASKLRPQAPLEQYGIDSLLAMKLVTHLESIFGKLPKTLAFEYQTIAQMCDYFRAEHGPRLSELLQPAPTLAQDRTPSPAGAATRGPAATAGSLARRPPTAPAAPSAAMATSSAPVVAAAALADARPPTETDEPIAIVGLSGRYPEAWDLDAYWRNLAEGRDCIREVPAERWRWQDYYREPGTGAALDAGGHSSRWGGFIEGADEFDARFFNVTPRDAEQIDPQERLFLQHAWMAIEDAGYTRAGLQALRGGQVGVYAGVMYGEYNRSGSLASIANRVSYVLNVHGPSMTLDTMCSSSLTAIHLACQDLRAGRTDMALAGGVNLSLHPGKYSMLSAGQFISTAGQCQSFGEGGDGYIPGEGVGVVVLKRLSDAERDGDAIHAVIRGSALNHGGKTNGYTVPNPQAQAAVVAEALKVSGVDARHVSYIEAHGTGTKLGDPIEIAALGKAFREYTQETGFCQLGSAKSNIGHCESAAGIAGLTKVVLQLRHRRIVPSLHSAKLNPNIDFAATPFVVNQTLREWEAPVLDGRVLPRIAGLSSFGAGGANAHVVIEEYAAAAAHAGATVGMPTGLPLIVSLSARTFEQLRLRAQDLRGVLASDDDLDLAAMAWTLHVGREAMDARLGIRADSREDLIGKLDAFLAAGEPEDGALADDIHYAQTRRHRDMVEMFEADADLRASVDQWFATGKFARLLEMWTKGLDVDWRRLYGANPPRRMHLPVYPFARERYWRDEPPVGIAQVQRPADALHSLLHRNASRPGLQRYRSDFAATDPRMAGLRRLGLSSLPHALQLEAARVALADALSGPDASWSLCDVRFGAPAAVDGDWPVAVSVLLPGQGERPSPSLAAFEVGLGDDGGGVLCQGLAERSDAQRGPGENGLVLGPVDIGTLLAQASPLFADRGAVLAAERGIGVEVDAPYRVVESIHRTRDGLLLRLEASADAATPFADCAIPPAALEAALRAAVWLAPSSRQPWLPAGLSRLRLLDPVASATPRYALLRLVAQAADALEVVLTLCSEHGRPLLHIDGLQLRPAALQALPARDASLQSTTPVPSPAQAGRAPAAPASPADGTQAAPARRDAVRFRAGPVAASMASTQRSLFVEPAAQAAAFAAAPLAKPAAVSLPAPAHSAMPEPTPVRGKPALALSAPAAPSGATSPAAGQSAAATLSDRGDGVFALRLDAGERLDTAAVDVLSQALAHAAQLPELRLLLIEAGEGGLPVVRDPVLDAQQVDRLLRTLDAFPLPTAAVLSGDAFGIGLRLACACDLLVAVEDGRYGFVTEAGTDFGPGAASAWLNTRFGEALAAHLAFAERAFDGRELQAAGLGCLLVARDALAAAVDALGRSLADKSPAVLRTLKSHLAREFAAAVAARDVQPPAEPDASARIADAADTAHPAVVLAWIAPGRASLRIRNGVAEDDADLLRQLLHALHACREAAVLRLSSDIEGFLPEAAAKTGEALDAVLAAVAGLRMPVLAVVERGARDAGLLLALACDRMICSASGQYGGLDLQAHRTRLGTVEALLARRAGARGREWLLSGEVLDGAALRRAMPLLPICEPSALAARVEALTERLTALPRAFARKSLPVAHDAAAPADDDAGRVAAEQGDLALSTDVVRAHVDADGVVLLRLQDRQARNMFSDALIAGVQEAFERIGRLPNARAVVVVGYDTYFASGGTQSGLKAIQEGRVRFTDLDIFQSALRCPLPVVAAMQGHGIGAGWTLGLFCDCLLFGAESRYLSPYMNFGFTPGAGATGILPEKLGYDLARYSLFTGEEITGETLARRNPSLHVLPRDRVLEAALSLARSIARHPRADLVAWKAAAVGHRFDAWQALLAREVEMHEATLVGQADALDRIERGFGASSQPAAASGFAPMRAPAPVAAAAAVRSQPEILGTIRRLLAEELRIAESEIDPQTPFVDLGLDSISSVTWIRRINETFALSIEATQVYNHPNLQKLARFVGERMPAASTPVAVAPLPAAPAVQAPVAAAPANAASSPPIAPSARALARPASAATVDLAAVRRVLVELLAEELRQTPDSIDPEVGFVDLGLDSISGVTWIRGVNQRYGTAIEATKVYTYPTIAKFARYLHGLLVDAASAQSGAPDAALSADAPAPAGQGASMAVATEAGGRPSTLSMTSGFDWPPLSTWVRLADPAAGPAAAGTTAASPAASRQAHPAEIAVIGMAGRFPMAADVDAFWENIASGRNCISEVPETRWDTRAYYVDGQPALGQSNSKWMGVLEGHDRFDPQFFGLSPLEAEAMDPQQRLFLECCWHGMEDAGYTSERLSGSRCGVFVGCAYGDYNLLSREQQINALGFTGGATSILAARVSYFMNLQGPCVSIDTACSSSLVAIAAACDSLVTGGADMAFAGGVYVMANADMFLKTAHAGMLSPDGRCYTFDQRANGFVPGEAVGVVMLKRLADAERDGDDILGVLRGWGVNQDGRTNGITAPNAESQQRLMSDVYKRFDIDPEQIQLIEAHGTGTKLGDPIEVEGLKAAFLPATQRKGYCAIGSVKTNIGHCLTAAGTSGLIKLLLSLKHKALPPSINFERPNEHLDLDDSPFYVNTRLRDWEVPPGVPRQAAISSFGFSGTNAHLVLAEYAPSAAAESAGAQPPPPAGVIVALSARNADRLRRRAQDLHALVRSRPEIDLVSMACTLQLHRDAMDERLCFVARSAQDVLAGLQAYIDGKPSAAGLPGSVFAGNIRQGRESVRLLNEDPAMAGLVVEKCIADAQFSRLCELWVKGLALDWRTLYGPRKPPMMALPKYPFAEERYWISVDQAAFAPAVATVDRSAHLHPLLQAKVADLCELGYRPVVGGGEVVDRSTSTVKAIHLPTYAFARMRCWIPTREEAAAQGGAVRDGHAGAIPPSGRLLQNMDSVAALFAELEQDRLTAEEVTARVRQLA